MSRPKPSSRENGRLSHGPTTQDGKDRVRFNALRHGLRSERAVVLEAESQEDFDRLLDAHQQRFQPRDQVEADAITDLAAARWRLRRLEKIETGLLERALGQVGAADSPDKLAEAFTALAGNRVFDLLLRYEGRLQSAFQRGLRTLIVLREKLPSQMQAEESAATTETEAAPVNQEPPPAVPNEPIFTVPLSRHAAATPSVMPPSHGASQPPFVVAQASACS